MKHTRLTLSHCMLWLALLVLAIPTAHAATYHVSNSGSNASNGLTPATAFATLQYCAGLANPGDTFLVADGNYTGFNITRSGTSGSPITFRATGSAARITAPNAFTTRDGMNIEGGDWIVIDGFICSNLERAGIRAVNADHCIIRRNTCETNGRWGIFTGFTDDLVVEHNLCAYSVAEHGIYVSNSSDRAILRGNRCHHNRGGGIQINADLSQGGDGLSSDCQLYNNIIWENGLGGGAAINLDGAIGAQIYNNLLYENHATGIALFQIDGATSSRNAVIYHNTIVQAANGRWCLLLVDGATGATIRNNVFVAQHSFRGTIAADAASLSGLSSDYNLHSDRLSIDGANTNMTLAAWRTATGQDTHSITAPALSALFVDQASANFRLTGATTALNAGTTLAYAGAASDAFGVARPQGAAPDLGAFERITSPTPASTARFVNLSTRARTTATDPVIAGFVIVGSGDRNVLIRVVGPTLATFGVAGALDDPRLALYAGASSLATNDNWSSAANAAAIVSNAATVGAFALSSNSADAAYFGALAPGAYTVQGLTNTGAPATGGVVLVEIYDAGGPVGSTSRLANVSTRAIGGHGEDAVIAGFVLEGASSPVALRGIGPALADFGITNALNDPRLTLYQGNASIGTNDHWADAPNATALALLSEQLGAFTLRPGSSDAALHTTLVPGSYTLHAAPAASTVAPGVALAEVYAP